MPLFSPPVSFVGASGAKLADAVTALVTVLMAPLDVCELARAVRGVLCVFVPENVAVAVDRGAAVWLVFFVTVGKFANTTFLHS